VSQRTLQHIKAEDRVVLEPEQTTIIHHTLLQETDPETSLVQYTEADQEEVVLSAGNDLSEKILLETSVVSDNLSSHPETIHVTMSPITSGEEHVTEALSTSTKRKLDNDSSDQHNYTAKQQKVVA
jgi:hypothetical protein